MRKVKNLILTFDYEVFLGQQTGNIVKSVIRPTDQILRVLKQNNARAIFFVDTTWLLFLKGNFYEDFKLVSLQLKDIIESGSSVELHLHPQWLKAYRKGDKIVFGSDENYRLHSLSQDNIVDLFNKSIELLESITLQKIQCFRAGGFCIEPFEQVKRAFEITGIKYDFSVVPGMFLRGGNEYDFDFSDVQDIPFYHFQNDIKKPDPKGNFIEIPLSIYQNNPFYRLTNKLLLKLNKDKIFGDGKGIQEKSHFFLRSLSRRIAVSKAFLTIDNTNSRFFKYLLKFHFADHYILVIISHPKTLSRQALINLLLVTQKYITLNSGNLSDLLIS